jgi:hypothetical protein
MIYDERTHEPTILLVQLRHVLDQLDHPAPFDGSMSMLPGCRDELVHRDTGAGNEAEESAAGNLSMVGYRERGDVPLLGHDDVAAAL